MNFVDVDDAVAFAGHAFHDALDAFLEVAAILRSGQHRAHVHLVDATAFQTLGHVAALDARCQSVDQRRLSHAGLAHVQRVVLLLSAEHLQRAFQFLLAADERIVLAHQVVHAGHQLAPGLLLDFSVQRVVLLAIVVDVEFLVAEAMTAVKHVVVGWQTVLEVLALDVVEADEMRHEFGHLVLQIFLQHIGSPRLLQTEHGIGEMGHVGLFAAGEERVVAGGRNEFRHLHRHHRFLLLIA